MIQSSGWDAMTYEMEARAYVDQAMNGLVRTEAPLAGPYQGTDDMSPEQGKAQRGTTNRNARGGSDDRRRRREWLVASYRADVDVIVIELFHGPMVIPTGADAEGSQPACRCYRCGALLTVDTVTADRVKPGCQGGTYRRDNIRPACGPCNSLTGATLGNQRKRTKRQR